MPDNNVATGGNPEQQRVDRLGAFASSVCAVHCALSASLPEVLAALGLGALLGHAAEWGFVLAALVFATAALYLGWRKHRSPWPTATLAVGIVALLVATLLEEAIEGPMGTALSVLAGLTLVIGHLANLRASRHASPSLA